MSNAEEQVIKGYYLSAFLPNLFGLKLRMTAGSWFKMSKAHNMAHFHYLVIHITDDIGWHLMHNCTTDVDWIPAKCHIYKIFTGTKSFLSSEWERGCCIALNTCDGKVESTAKIHRSWT